MEKKQIETSDDPLERKYFKPIVIISLVVAALVAYMPWMGKPGVADPDTAGSAGLWMNFLGHFHPLFLHLPIGALMLVFCMEGLSIITRGKYKANTTLALAFAAVTAVIAVVFGYFWYLTGEFNADSMDDHKRDGVIFTVLMIITFLLKYSSDIKGWSLGRLCYLPLLGLTGITMMSAGHHGGKMSHGDPMKELPSTILSERKKKDVVVTDPVIYANIIHTILDNKCISCHGEDKQKGDLRVDSIAHMLDGGAEEECLVPGKPKESYLLTSLDLPMDDDFHMPPKGKPQITPEEKKILTWWIQIGAPENKKLSEIKNIPEEITAAIATLKTPEQLEAEKQQLRKEEEQRIAKMKANRQRLQKSWDDINAKFPGSLRYASQQDTSLTFSTVSYRKVFVEQDLSILKDVAADVVELDLSSIDLTDAGVAYLKEFKNLEKLKLNETKITDTALKTIAGLESLKKLNLYGTAVTDAGVKELLQHPTLEKVYLWNTKVTPAAATDLEKALKQKAKAAKEADPKSKRFPEVLLGVEVKK